MRVVVVGSETQGWVALSLVLQYRIPIRWILLVHAPKFFPKNI